MTNVLLVLFVSACGMTAGFVCGLAYAWRHPMYLWTVLDLRPGWEIALSKRGPRYRVAAYVGQRCDDPVLVETALDAGDVSEKFIDALEAQRP